MLSKMNSEKLLLAFRRSYRAGVTLMEVIFAIGIILTGLLGLAALIPVAANNAKLTLEMDRSVSESTSMSASGIARNFNRLSRIVVYDKQAAGSVLPYHRIPPYSPALFPATGAPESLQSMATPFGVLNSPGFSHVTADAVVAAGICIDPLGLPEIANWNAPGALSGAMPAIPASPSAFEYTRFPYYTERYNVLNAPNAPVVAGAVPAWPMSPRMWRATLSADLQDDGAAPVRPRELMPSYALRRIFQGFGDISAIAGEEPSDPKGVLFDRTRFGGPAGTVYDGGRDNSSLYSWFATLAPPLLGGNQFRQSIVVVRQRSLVVPQRLNDPLALNESSYTVTEPEENPSSERLAWIGQAIGFSGGSGGEVLLYGSAAVTTTIGVNEWVMLSRQPFSGAAPNGAAVHRWYRVLRVDDPEYGFVTSDFAEANWTGGGDPRVWRRWVTLDGPDWSFGLTAPNSDLRDDTFCTIVTGAVSVFESEVTLVP